MSVRRNQIHREDRRSGFTLVELLIVVTIIVILTAVAIPAVLPAITSRRVSEAARVLQAQLAAARDMATRANAPRGVRLLPDPAFPGPQAVGDFQPLAYNRVVNLEGPPDHTDGLITVLPGMGWNLLGVTRMEFPSAANAALQIPLARVLVIVEQKYHTIPVAAGQQPIPNPPTNWYGNVRQGDKIYIPSLKRYFSIAGPIPRTVNGQLNSERLVGIDENSPMYSYYDRSAVLQYPAVGSPGVGTWPPPVTNADWTGYGMRWPEFLIVTNGVDDDGNGFVDEHFDGVDNNADGIIDPGFNGVHENTAASYPDSPLERMFVASTAPPGAQPEWENDADLGLATLANDPLSAVVLPGHEYRIVRRPIPAQGSSEVTLPGDVLIDATTSTSVIGYGGGASNSRSRLPIGPEPSYYADFMIAPSGQVLQAVASANQAPPMEFPFLHFWLAEREDVMPPYLGADDYLKLPIPKGIDTSGEANYPAGTFLNKGRRLLSVFTRTGQIVSNSVENFDVNNSNLPFIAPQRGAREAQ